MIIVQCQMPLHAIVRSWKICTLEATGHLVLSNHVLGPLLLFMGLNVYLRREEEEEEEGEGGGGRRREGINSGKENEREKDVLRLFIVYVFTNI